MIQETLCIIKPDVYENKQIGRIITDLEESGFEIVKMELVQLTKEEAEEFYREHKDKDFFRRNIDFIVSGPCIVLVLRKENAIKDLRRLIGPTAGRYTLRETYGTDLPRNAVHGSDSEESAEREIYFFFDGEAYVLSTLS